MIEQGTEAWKLARAGHVTASRLGDMMAGGSGLTRDKYRCQLAIERMTGKPIEGFKSYAMQQGNEREPLARSYYEFQQDVDVVEAGFTLHTTIKNTGASPDGLVGDDGLIEIKSPELHTHIKYLISGVIPKDYIYQMQYCMEVFNRQWCDFISYNPDMPVHLRLSIFRVYRDDEMIKILCNEIVAFDQEIENLIKKLEQK
jgi:putative phage-type endonuclease